MATDTAFPRAIFVHMGHPKKADYFFNDFYPEALAIGDPNQALHIAFEIRNGSISQFFKPAVWKAYWANRKFGIGSPVGNTMRNPGAVLVRNQKVLYQQTSAGHFGEQVDIEAVMERLRSSDDDS